MDRHSRGSPLNGRASYRHWDGGIVVFEAREAGAPEFPGGVNMILTDDSFAGSITSPHCLHLRESPYVSA
jgi:hypothetical protein